MSIPTFISPDASTIFQKQVHRTAPAPTPKEALAAALNLSSIDAATAAKKASDPSTTKATLFALAQLEHVEVSGLVLENPALTVVDRMMFARSRDYRLRIALVNSERATPKLLMAAAACSRHASRAAGWESKARRQEGALRAAVARHKNADSKVLAFLSNDPVLEVLTAVVTSDLVPTETLVAMADREQDIYNNYRDRLDAKGGGRANELWLLNSRARIVESAKAALRERVVVSA